MSIHLKPLAYNPRDPWAVLICDKLGRVDGELCRVHGSDSAETDYAYARLFAASPEVLAGLREALNAYILETPYQRTDHEMVGRLQGVIAKAAEPRS